MLRECVVKKVRNKTMVVVMLVVVLMLVVMVLLLWRESFWLLHLPTNVPTPNTNTTMSP